MKVIPIQQAASAIVTPDTALSPAPGEALFDRRGRSVRDLRISVTDRCNFRCVYCMPREVFGDDYTFLPRRELLSFEEIVRVASLFVTRYRAQRLPAARRAVRHECEIYVLHAGHSDSAPCARALTMVKNHASTG